MNRLRYLKPSEAQLREEKICGFDVSRERKAVWAVELDLLMAFQTICKENGLRYYMFGGSMLGTARHGGFIPWDDDIDVIMPREDYDRFLKIAPKAFSDPYVFENPVTDGGKDYYLFSKLRNKSTSGMFETSSPLDKNRGLWMDIFVLDDTITYLAPLHYFVYGAVRLLSKIFPVSNALVFRIWNAHERIFKGMRPNGYMQGMGPFTYRIYHDRGLWEDPIWKDFCGVKVPVPRRYEEILTLCYGDWKKYQVKGEHIEIRDNQLL